MTIKTIDEAIIKVNDLEGQLATYKAEVERLNAELRAANAPVSRDEALKNWEDGFKDL